MNNFKKVGIELRLRTDSMITLGMCIQPFLSEIWLESIR